MVTLIFSQDIIDHLEHELSVCEKTNNLRLHKKISCLLMISQGQHFRVIAERLKIHPKSVYNWFKRFIVRRFSWLLGKHYANRGQKSKLTTEQKKELHELVERGPEASGFDSGIWTTAMIVEVVNEKFGVRYHSTRQFLTK